VDNLRAGSVSEQMLNRGDCALSQVARRKGAEYKQFCSGWWKDLQRDEGVGATGVIGSS